jgi:hypothetical protein
VNVSSLLMSDVERQALLTQSPTLATPTALFTQDRFDSDGSMCADVNQLAAKLKHDNRLSFPGWELGKRVPQPAYRMHRPPEPAASARGANILESGQHEFPGPILSILSPSFGQTPVKSGAARRRPGVNPPATLMPVTLD